MALDVPKLGSFCNGALSSMAVSAYGEQSDQGLLSLLFKDIYSCILGVIILSCYNPVTMLIRAQLFKASLA